MTEDQKGPTVIDLPKRDDLAASLAIYTSATPALIEHAKMQAKVRRAAYLAAIAEGFNEAQALDLCWRA